MAFLNSGGGDDKIEILSTDNLNGSCSDNRKGRNKVKIHNKWWPAWNNYLYYILEPQKIYNIISGCMSKTNKTVEE